VEAIIADVQAFLDRRLVSAYRYGIGRRISRWVQRHPASSVGMGVAGVLLAVGAAVTIFLLQQAEIARVQAKVAAASRDAAEARAETAVSILDKSRRVSAVLRGASVELAPVHETLVRNHWSRLSLEEKRARAVALWPRVRTYARNLPGDTATQAAWLALEGWLKRLGGFEEEAMRLFERSRETDPDVAYGALFESMHWLSRYIGRQPLPAPMLSLGGIEFLDVEGESPDMTEARKHFEALIETVHEAGVWGEASAEEFASVLDGFQGMQNGDFEAAERGLTRALNVPEMTFLTTDLLFARANVRHRLKKFKAGIEDLEAVRKACPDHPGVYFYLGELWLGEALLAQLRGEDPRPSLKRTVDFHTKAIEKGMWAHYAQNARGTAHLLRAGWETRNGIDAEASLRSAETDFSEAIRIAGDRPHLLSNRGSTLRSLARLLETRGRDPAPVLERALEDLQRAVDAAPRLWFPRHILAKIYGSLAETKKRNPAEARPYLDKAVAEIDTLRRLAPERIEPREVESMVLRVLGDVQERMREDPRPSYARAIEAARRVLDRTGPSAMQHVNLGAAQANLAQAMYRYGEPGLKTYEEALASFNEAIRLEPGLSRAYMNQVLILRRLGRFEEARETLAAMKERGREPVNLGNIETSIQVIEYAKIAPPWMVVMLEAHQLYNGGDFPRAAPRYEKALALMKEAGVEIRGTEAQLVGVARLRLAVIAALASEGRNGPLAPKAPPAEAEAKRRRDLAIANLKASLEAWPPLRKKARATSAFHVLEDDPAFRLLMNPEQGK
jgi:tetratricopeptide (TPR) repeat protein